MVNEDDLNSEESSQQNTSVQWANVEGHVEQHNQGTRLPLRIYQQQIAGSLLEV